MCGNSGVFSVAIGTSPPEESLLVMERCTYLNIDRGGANWTCPFSLNPPIHQALGCKHYSQIRKLLEENLLSNELNIFNVLECDMEIARIDHDISSDGRNGYFNDEYGVFTNIEKDASGLQHRTKYQITIHELWHNIDLIAGKQSGTTWHDTNAYRAYANNPEMRRRGIEANKISYLFNDNRICNAVRADINRRSDGNYERFINDINVEIRRLQRMEREFLGERQEESTATEEEFKARKLNFVRERSAFHYLFDILSGDYWIHNRRTRRPGWLTRNQEVWMAETRAQFFATECFADIGCTKGANPDGMAKIETYLPETCGVYNEIMAFIESGVR